MFRYNMACMNDYTLLIMEIKSTLPLLENQWPECFYALWIMKIKPALPLLKK